MTETHILNVQGMTCGHCARAVTEAIRAEDSTAEVTVDLQGKTVRATTSLPRQRIAELVTEEGYTVAA
ncbi:cation transporter [Roseomonas sp. E05]|uniref:heavy-metal-associated domain-containing protein n=1 Tax=Roseomonas sp. E05 TaxID=3046310 RepID=UPI0024B9EAAF|nr:cation transporter [Roseomonas sp. E05]MDJ0389778.1 cation transporter [Roseomonas sp. E05]